MANPTKAELKRLGAAITLPREKFGEIYDPLARAKDGYSAMNLRAMSGDAAPFLPELQQAVKLGFFRELCELLDATHALEPEPTTAQGKKAQLELQAMVNPAHGMWAVGELMYGGGAQAQRRVCQILVDVPGQPAKGTGFLVGQDTVLTAHHVVSAMLAGNAAAAGSHARITIEFDKVGSWKQSRTVRVAEQWYVGGSSPHPTEQPTQVALDFDSAVEIDFDKHLDYAVIRLAEPVGRERGFFNLDKDRYPCVDAVGSQIIIFQHPRGDNMHISSGAGLRLWPKTFKTRLRHDANTVSGSSGGLVLDNALKPVALHQCGIQIAGEDKVVNGAIPTACIAAHGGDLGALDVVPSLRLDNGEPVIGRDRFQRAVMQALHAQISIIAVGGPPGVGKTFSGQIVSHHVDNVESVIAKVDASELTGEAPDVAGVLLKSAGVRQEDIATLPRGGDAATAVSAWLRDELFPRFCAILAASAGPRLTWVLIDNLDTSPLPDSTGRQFLERMYQDIAAAPSLRIVLIGISGAVPGAPAALVASETLGEPVALDIETYIRRRAAQLGAPLPPAKLRDLVAIVVGEATGPSLTRREVAAAIKSRIEPLLAQGALHG